MPEKAFQQALMHLYMNIDYFHSYSDDQFNEFELSESERRSLRELLTCQRDGLLLFSELLRRKLLLSIREALPKSRAIVPHQLDAALQAYASLPTSEGASDGPGAIRSFANYLSAQIESRAEVPEELELIWFEAVCASVSLPAASASIHAGGPRSPQLFHELQLKRDGVALISCTYNIPAAIHDPSLLGIRDRPSKSYWFFMFRTVADEVRVLAVALGLAQLIAMLMSGSSVGEVLESLERGTDRIAATASLEKLTRLGALFFSTNELADRDCESQEVSDV